MTPAVCGTTEHSQKFRLLSVDCTNNRGYRSEADDTCSGRETSSSAASRTSVAALKVNDRPRSITQGRERHGRVQHEAIRIQHLGPDTRAAVEVR